MAKQANSTPLLFQLCLNAASPVLTDPLFNCSLLVDPSRHTVTGIVEMIQKTEPRIVRFDVKGTFHKISIGEVTYVITLSGEYWLPFPPPAIGEIAVPFSASILLGSNWNGKGTFHYGHNQVEQAIVTKHNCPVAD